MSKISCCLQNVLNSDDSQKNKINFYSIIEALYNQGPPGQYSKFQAWEIKPWNLCIYRKILDIILSTGRVKCILSS